jgi:type I restriction enzyme S subunit
MTGSAGQRRVPKMFLEELEIPLPPLVEQKRIAAILDLADELRQLRQRAIDRFSVLGPAIFQEMFGDPVSSGGPYQAVTLESVAELINGDRSSNYPSGDDLVEDGVLFLSTKNIQSGEIDLTTRQFITPEKFRSLTRGKLRRHDIVLHFAAR